MVTGWGMAEGVSGVVSVAIFLTRGGSQFGCKYLSTSGNLIGRSFYILSSSLFVLVHT
jgi:hypothetical protein